MIHEMSVTTKIGSVVGVAKTKQQAKKLCARLYRRTPDRYNNTATDDNHRIPVFAVLEFQGIRWVDSFYYNSVTNESDPSLVRKWFWCERCQKLVTK